MNQKGKWNTFYASKKRESFLHFTEEQVDELLNKFPDAKTALDIGCGEGQLLIQLEKLGITATGIDVSDVGLNEAKKNFRGTIILADFQEFEFPDGSAFDLIFVKFVISFINHPEAFFEKVDCLLKLNGGFILLTPVMPNHNPLSSDEEVFVDQTVLDTFLPRYFSSIQENVLYAEGTKRLVLYTCIKK